MKTLPIKGEGRREKGEATEFSQETRAFSLMPSPFSLATRAVFFGQARLAFCTSHQ
jgi:hypothetical protein